MENDNGQPAERAEHVIEVPTPNGVLCSCGKWFFSAGFTAHVVAALREDLAAKVEAERTDVPHERLSEWGHGYDEALEDVVEMILRGERS